MMEKRKPGRTVDICVCTFRRPYLGETLRSLDRLRVPAGVAVSIIVADNDETPSAEQLIEGVRGTVRFPIRYRHAPARNISLARNACLDESRADFVAFIDDDEIATPEWLERLLETAGEFDADVVLGPVRALYGEDAPTWMRSGDFHSTYPVVRKQRILTGYTCNVLLRTASRSVAGRRFDLARGRSGGEDTAYFAKVTNEGGTIAYAPDAWVEEPVTSDRTSLSWLARRRFRVGQTHGRLLAEDASAWNRGRAVGLAASKAAFCYAAAVATAYSAIRRNRYLLRGIMHTGVVGGLLGQREIKLYGTPVPDSERVT
jgi:succinoglycan biosynthesis protein ExoM